MCVRYRMWTTNIHSLKEKRGRVEDPLLSVDDKHAFTMPKFSELLSLHASVVHCY